MFSLHFVKSIETLIQPSIGKLNELIESGKLKYDEFTNNMYDPNSLLFVRLLLVEHENNFINMTNVTFDCKTTEFRTKYENTIHNQLNFKTILEFQNLLCGVVADIFYKNIYESLTRSYKMIIENQHLLKSFDTVIKKILQNNCLLYLCN